MCSSPGGASRFQCPGLARPLGVILRRRPCFFVASLPETPMHRPHFATSHHYLCIARGEAIDVGLDDVGADGSGGERIDRRDGGGGGYEAAARKWRGLLRGVSPSSPRSRSLPTIISARAPIPTCPRDEGTDAGPVRRGRYRHSRGSGRGAEGGVGAEQQDGAVLDRAALRKKARPPIRRDRYCDAIWTSARFP